MRIQELEDVLRLVDELPEEYQKRAARDLRFVVAAHEDNETMTEEERWKQWELREEESDQIAIERINRWRIVAGLPEIRRVEPPGKEAVHEIIRKMRERKWPENKKPPTK